MVMNDYKMNVGSLFKDNEIGFETFQKPSRIMPYPNKFQNAITFEMSLSQIELLRKVYNFLDFLSDLGGLFSTLGPFCGIIVTIFQYRGSYLRLMKDMGEAEESYNKTRNFSKKKRSNIKCCPVFFLNLRMRCPKKLKCCDCLKMNEL